MKVNLIGKSLTKIKIAGFYKIQENSMKKMKNPWNKKTIGYNLQSVENEINVLSEIIGQFNINDLVTIK